MRRQLRIVFAAALVLLVGYGGWGQPPLPANKTITEADCTAERLGTTIPVSPIGEIVRGITLRAPVWVAATDRAPAICTVDGSMAPMDSSATARLIHFRVVLPASWSYRSAQIGGGGMNGVIPNLTAALGITTGPSPLQRGFATYGSDSGHQAGTDWALNDEAIKNLGYMQMKKTHDAAMVLIQRMYDERPRFNYFFGTSQGGREALTVAQRYEGDYDGIIANVPIVGFSSLMLAPELIRIQEQPLANWVTPAKVNAIRGQFLRECDKLDGLVDGIMNNYMACRAAFAPPSGVVGLSNWAAKRCPDNVDPDPTDTSANTCLTDGQISTLRMVYSPLRSLGFGMWVPNTDPSGSGLILGIRFRGQEGAAEDAPLHSHLGVLGVTGFLMQKLV